MIILKDPRIALRGSKCGNKQTAAPAAVAAPGLSLSSSEAGFLVVHNYLIGSPNVTKTEAGLSYSGWVGGEEEDEAKDRPHGAKLR